MKRVCTVLLCFMLAVSALPIRAEKKDPSPYSLSDFTNREILAVYPDLHTRLFTYPTEEALKKAYEQFSADPFIAWIQPNFSYRSTALITNDALLPEQWALHNNGAFSVRNNRGRYPIYQNPFHGGQAPDLTPSLPYDDETAVSGVDIGIQGAWSLYQPQQKAIVALIDTGVDFSHPDLKTCAWVNSKEIRGNGIDDDRNGYVDDYYGYNFYDHTGQMLIGSDDNHGTHCAGTIAASTGNRMGIAGIAGDGSVGIMNLKALGGADGSGTTDSIVDAIHYAEANGASVCNLSLCTENYDRLFYQTIRASRMLFVVAAGNGEKDTSYFGYNLDEHRVYPAAFPCDNIIAVANLAPSGILHRTSCYGKATVDLAAPGTNILSTVTDAWYAYMTGTSMAAPMVSAVCAMLYSQYPYLSAEEVRALILQSVTSSPSLKGLVFTDGYLSAEKAFYAARSAYSLRYRDIVGCVGQDEILTASRNGWLLGVGNGSFSPNAPMTRAMGVTVLYRLQFSPNVSDPASFGDVSPDSWYASAVAWAEKTGVSEGFPDGNFYPDQPLSREQMATLFYRFYRLSEPVRLNPSSLPFRDADRISPWAVESVAWATDANAFSHLGDHLEPEHFASRAEMAIMLVRMSER